MRSQSQFAPEKNWIIQLLHKVISIVYNFLTWYHENIFNQFEKDFEGQGLFF